MNNCCEKVADNLCSQLECTVNQTKEGIQVDIRPKDSNKVGSLHAIEKGLRDFCDCC